MPRFRFNADARVVMYCSVEAATPREALVRLREGWGKWEFEDKSENKTIAEMYDPYSVDDLDHNLHWFFGHNGDDQANEDEIPDDETYLAEVGESQKEEP
jgi:hypothetical protein